MGAQIEAHYGTPQDIEWALVGPDIFITQSRPITSLFPLPVLPEGDAEARIFLSLSHLQVMTDPMPPMSISIWRHLPPVAQDDDGQYAFVQSIGSRMYADISPLLRHRLMGRAFVGFLGVADQISQAAITEAITDPTFKRGKARLHLFRYLWAMRSVARKVPATLLFGPPKSMLADVNAIIATYRRSEIPASVSPAEGLESALESLRDIVPLVGTWIPRLAAGIISQRLLRKIVPEAAHPLLDDFERGVEGNIVTEMNLALGDLADMVAENGDLHEHLSTASKLTSVLDNPKFATFHAAWNNFLGDFGARATSGIDSSKPRWSEAPQPLIQMILGLAQRDERGAHRDHFTRLTDASHEAESALLKQARWPMRPIVRRLMTNARTLMPLREHHKFLMVLGFARVRTAVLIAGKHLADTDQIETADHVWFFELPELRRALAGRGCPTLGVIAARRDAFDHDASRSPPRVMTDRGEIPQPKLELEDAPEGALIGSPVSAGTYEGRAHVVIDPATEILAPGDILVAPFTDPGWTPLFVNAGALVTEVGGLMTHGSVVARKYGIPAVVGVIDATKLIKTGDRLRIDGSRGIVEILDEDMS